MKRKHYYYFELAKGDAYFLYDEESLIKLDSPLSIGDERKVKNEVTKLPKDKNGKMPIVTYSKLRSVTIKEKRHPYYHFELETEDGYLLYDRSGLIKKGSPISIGSKSEVKSAVTTKLPKDENGQLPPINYSKLINVSIQSGKIVFEFEAIEKPSGKKEKLSDDNIIFDFKRDVTIDFEDRKKTS
jgi:hypothetical protein